ncbi:MAG TPA: Flp pilus assembly protein CpaB [Pyrinomonadaceae bacterium]
MRNKRLIVVLAGAVVFGVIAAVSVSRYLSNAQGFTRGMNKVVVAKVEIPLGESIVAEQLTTASFPADGTPDGVFDSPEKLIGRVAVVQIAAREPVTDFKLAAEGAQGGLGATIPEGYRAMSVKVDDVVGVAGFIKPGAMVDVLTVIEPSREQGARKDAVSKIVLQNVKVLSNGQNIDKPKNEREAESVRVVTLLVTPEQAEKLALAAVEGKLRLVMRNTIDQGDEKTPGADKNSLLTGEAAKPAPEPGALKSEQRSTPAAPRPVFHQVKRASAPAAPKVEAAPAPAPPRPSAEMIQGSKRSIVEFP